MFERRAKVLPEAKSPAIEHRDAGVGAASRESIIQGMSPADRKAFLSFEYAQTNAGKKLDDQEAYCLLKDEGIPDRQGETGDLTGYDLPAFLTWARQLRSARKALGEQKYKRRARRVHGKSIVNSDEIERGKSKNE